MTISLQRREERGHVQARRALLECELNRWLPLLIAMVQAPPLDVCTDVLEAMLPVA